MQKSKNLKSLHTIVFPLQSYLSACWHTPDVCCRPFRCVAEKELNVLLHWKSICIQLQVSVTLTGLLRQTGAAKKVISPKDNPGSYHFCNILCHESVSSSWVYQITMARGTFFLFYLQGSHTLICTTPCFASVVFPSKPMKSWKSSRGFFLWEQVWWAVLLLQYHSESHLFVCVFVNREGCVWQPMRKLH